MSLFKPAFPRWRFPLLPPVESLRHPAVFALLLSLLLYYADLFPFPRRGLSVALLARERCLIQASPRWCLFLPFNWKVLRCAQHRERESPLGYSKSLLRRYSRCNHARACRRRIVSCIYTRHAASRSFYRVNQFASISESNAISLRSLETDYSSSK